MNIWLKFNKKIPNFSCDIENEGKIFESNWHFQHETSIMNDYYGEISAFERLRGDS